MGRLLLRLGKTPSTLQANPSLVRKWHPSPGASALLIPLIIYAVTRFVSYAMILSVADAKNLSVADLMTAWDGTHYRQITLHGYPPTLPLDDNGKVQQNGWAFSPLYPLLVRGLISVSGLSYDVAAPGLSLVAGAAAAVVMFALVSQTAGRVAAVAGVALTGTFMAAPVMQLAYTESLALLLVCSVLLLLRRRRYLLASVAILLLSITRPIALAFVPVIFAHGMSLRHLGPGISAAKSGRRAFWGLWGACIAGGVLWPVTVAIATGYPFAWFESEAAWVTTPTAVPGLGWFRFFQGAGWAGLVMLVIITVIIVGMMSRQGATPWGIEMRAWTLSYCAYLFFATAPVPSIIRFMLLAFPLFWPFPSTARTSKDRLSRGVLFILLTTVGVACQWVWISQFLAAVGPSKLYP